MKHVLLLFTLAVFTSFADLTQPKPPVNYPKGYFQQPVAHTMQLSGTFGELRANHFHSGIDISPAPKQSNEPIYSAAEGYVSRISIRSGGYGQAIFIAHPNGYTTVYAHLEKLAFSIDTFVKKRQYLTESFEQDLILPPQDLPILRGQQIGLMGNRGHSSGQHLHFEIRDTKTDRPINPLLFGFFVADQTPPVMRALKVYFFNDKKEVVNTKTLDVIRKGSEYSIFGDTIFVPSAQVAFGLKTYDKQDGKSGDNGVFAIDMKQNDSLIYAFKAEQFGFDETRYLNAHLDYQAQMTNQGFFNRTFLLPGNVLSMYENVVNNGIISASTETKKITMESKDVAGNSAKLTFYIQQKDFSTFTQPKDYTYYLPHNEPSIIKVEGAKFYFSKGSFYENVYLKFAQTTEGGTFGTYSPTYHVHNAEIPIQWQTVISIKPIGLPDSLRDKAFIAYCPKNQATIFNCGGGWSDEGYLVAKNNRFGQYCMMVDRTPPTIIPVRFQWDMRKSTKISFRIQDNFESTGGGEGLKYKATVDGFWILMEFDAKNNLLFHQFDERISQGEHQLRIEVTDNRRNVGIYEAKFIK